MIYAASERSDPICQGDIFRGLPRVDLSLTAVPVVGDDGQRDAMPWERIAVVGEPVTALVALRPVTAIVASQDCDAQHNRDITLCEIRPFPEIYSVDDKTGTSGWVSVITEHARKNLKWFYLPPDPDFGFVERMGVDFPVTLRVPRTDLESIRHLRMGRLNPEADEHFRERISEYFRRYPYDEWYPLTKVEYDLYKKKHPEAAPRSYQR
jgi:hypothetical protein